MNDKNKKKFLWGNYDYSDTQLNSKSNINNNNKEEENKSILNPIKDKIKDGINKINPSGLYNKLKTKINGEDNENNDKNNHKNKTGIVDYTPNYGNAYEEEDNDYQITCLIDEYKDRVIGKEHVIFYKIELSSSLSGKKWDVYHSYQEFNDLYTIYHKLFLEVPFISWSHSKTIRTEPIVHRELIQQLNTFINELLKKPSLLTSSFLVEFLELQNHFSDILIYKPLLRYDSNYDEMYSNNLCINDVLFLEESKLLLVGTGVDKNEKLDENANNNNDSGNSKYFGFMNKIGKIFKKNKEEAMNTCKGKFYIYNIIHNNNGEIMVVELHCLEVISEVIKIEFWYAKNIITLGLNNGQILIFRLYIKEMNMSSKEILEYIGTINYHTTPPLCCIINFNCGYTYSIEEYGKSVKICDLNSQNLVKEVAILAGKSKGLICIDYTISLDMIYERLFIIRKLSQ